MAPLPDAPGELPADKRKTSTKEIAAELDREERAGGRPFGVRGDGPESRNAPARRRRSYSMTSSRISFSPCRGTQPVSPVILEMSGSRLSMSSKPGS